MNTIEDIISNVEVIATEVGDRNDALMLQEAASNLRQLEQLATTGEAFNKAAWALMANLMGQENWLISDTDQSEWAVLSRAFLAASDLHRNAIESSTVLSLARNPARGVSL